MKRHLNLMLVLLLVVFAAISLSTGSTQVSVLDGLIGWIMQARTPEAIVIGELRLPRTLLAVTVGAALGLSGAALQGLLRNPLADPGLTGASQGAALGAASVFYFGGFATFGIAAPGVAGLIGAATALMLMLSLAGSSGATTVLLAGLAISTACSAALAAVLNFAPNPFAMQELVFWLLGSVAERGHEHLLLIVPALLAGATLIWRERAFLAALSLGEVVAGSLGYHFARRSQRVIAGSAILIGSAVSVAGSIGFVGLLIPHLIRPLVDHRPDRLLLPSAIAGACLVCGADILVRTLPSGQELKLGVLTSIVGAPFLIALIWKDRHQWR